MAWAGNEYAVPYDHVTDILPVRITQRELFVYAADLRCIARHELAPRGTGKKFDPDGFHRPRERKSPVDLDMLGMTFGHLGEQSAEFFRQMSAGPARIWGHQARLILLLRERYATTDLDAALGHALSYGAFDFKSIERILIARDLREYDGLPGTNQSPPNCPERHYRRNASTSVRAISGLNVARVEARVNDLRTLQRVFSNCTIKYVEPIRRYRKHTWVVTVVAMSNGMSIAEHARFTKMWNHQNA